MRATLMYGAGDVRLETVPDPVLQRSTDAIVRVLRSAICGSDLWPYGSLPASSLGRREVCCSHRTVTQEGRISPEEEGSLCRSTVSSLRSTATKRS